MAADPAADIGDLYAWTSADGRRLQLVMDIVGRRFSDQVQYVFQVDSGPALGRTMASTIVLCQFDTAGLARCWAGTKDRLQGDVGAAQGFWGGQRRFRVFAGPRDDPYFNIVAGTRAALNAANTAIRAGTAPADAVGYRRFDEATLTQISTLWRQTQGGPARNFLAGWKTTPLVVSIDLDLVNTGGPLLAIWGRTERSQRAADGAPPGPGVPIDRMGRALTGNALLGLSVEADIAAHMKESYNRASPAGWAAFAPEILRNLALYDRYDGTPGNQWQADGNDASPARYRRLAELLADDRRWVDSRQTRRVEYLAVERGESGPPRPDCGGRTPLHNVNGVFRSLLIRGTADAVAVADGVDRDDREHSTTEFPFLAAP